MRAQTGTGPSVRPPGAPDLGEISRDSLTGPAGGHRNTPSPGEQRGPFGDLYAPGPDGRA